MKRIRTICFFLFREELDINISEIAAKLYCVILPIPSRAMQRVALLRDNPDFWGPVREGENSKMLTMNFCLATCCSLLCIALGLRSISCRFMDHHYLDIWFTWYFYLSSCSRWRSTILEL